MFKLFATLLVASAAVMASPVHVRNVADVYDPKITSPVAAQVWGVGSTQVVSWDLTSIPESEYSKTGYLLLGYLENNSENLDIRHPLATGFEIGAGEVTITVPVVQDRDNYVVALLGDSGNISPEFTISNAVANTTNITA